MGFLDRKGTPIACPECGSRRARKVFWKIKCLNANCSRFDSAYAAEAGQNYAVNRDAASVFPQLQGTFSPGSGAIRIQYENFRGDHLTYLGDPEGAYRAGDHLVIRVAPTGRHISFRMSYILNRKEVEESLAAGSETSTPDANERRILNFHLRRGTTSPRFAEIRQRYPDYQP